MQDNLDYQKFFSELDINNELKIEEDLGNGYVRLKISEAERRQALQDINCVEDIITELLRNSRDAGSKNIFIATKKIAEKKRLIYFIDDGSGIPGIFHDLIFQSRVTSKLENGIRDSYGFHGRGMALFSIKLNVEDIKITFSDSGRGTCIYIDVDLEKIPEKKDQSILPSINKENGDIKITGGVKNIVKTILEFIKENKSINVYLGSPTQIIYTIKSSFIKDIKGIGKEFDTVHEIETFFKKNNLKLIDLPNLAGNYTLLGKLLGKYYNMDISERGLQRIIYDETNVLEPVNLIFENFEQIDTKSLSFNKNENNDKKANKIKLYDELKLAHRFKDREISYIIEKIKKEVEKLGSKYFIKVDDEIGYKRSNNKIDIEINLKQDD